jgi:SAM-dependent methyltransferase
MFRDPDGRLFSDGDRILRAVRPAGVAKVEALLASPAARLFVSKGSLVSSRVIEQKLDDAAVVLEHDRIAFPSFPYEWPPEMLHAAAELTLDLAEALLPEGLGLKDATPYNVLFRGTRPVFVDVLSIEPREARDPLWRPEAQFERTFLLPLIAMRQFGLEPASIFLARRDGLEPQDILRLTSVAQRFRPSLLLPVTLPAMLSRKQQTAAMYRPRVAPSAEHARLTLEMTLRRLRRQLRRWQPGARSSKWTDYTSAATGADVKRDLVANELRQLAPKRVLDVGCNTGTYSLLAARAGASVTAIDSDAAVVGEAWRAAVHEQAAVLPLVVDLTRPTPGTGWRNAECASFLDRARGSFDLVMMLAVVHHMTITERVPLPEVAALAAELTTRDLIVEWVGPEDPMAVLIARGRDDLDLGRESFERAFVRHFDIVRSAPTAAHRVLYVMQRRP